MKHSGDIGRDCDAAGLAAQELAQIAPDLLWVNIDRAHNLNARSPQRQPRDP